jgi:hypothetical protein
MQLGRNVLICLPKGLVATGRLCYHTHCYVESMTSGPNHSSNKRMSHHLARATGNHSSNGMMMSSVRCYCDPQKQLV